MDCYIQYIVNVCTSVIHTVFKYLHMDVYLIYSAYIQYIAILMVSWGFLYMASPVYTVGVVLAGHGFLF